MPADVTSIVPAAGGFADREQSSTLAADVPMLSIGQLAKDFGVTLRALRFYESRGLLSPQRSGTARLYDRRDRDRLAFILKAKQLGFTLREIEQLIAARPDDTGNDVRLSRQQCTEQIVLLERQKRTIETALAELRRTYSNFYVRVLAEPDRV
jgi:DNA-binding transcriptional MerR regulator